MMENLLRKKFVQSSNPQYSHGIRDEGKKIILWMQKGEKKYIKTEISNCDNFDVFIVYLSKS